MLTVRAALACSRRRRTQRENGPRALVRALLVHHGRRAHHGLPAVLRRALHGYRAELHPFVRGTRGSLRGVVLDRVRDGQRVPDGARARLRVPQEHGHRQGDLLRAAAEGEGPHHLSRADPFHVRVILQVMHRYDTVWGVGAFCGWLLFFAVLFSYASSSLNFGLHAFWVAVLLHGTTPGGHTIWRRRTCGHFLVCAHPYFYVRRESGGRGRILVRASLR